eukprot:Sspe_Gene.34485::Locus_16762_Transcript_1_1_Confidence_1.000_Length_1467::g.34485::m.34485/K16575/ACTR1, ARP1; centractin
MDIARSIVIDNGSGTIKAGFAGEEMPALLLQNIVGRPKHPIAMSGGALQGSLFVGDLVEHHRGVLKLSYPMEHGHVVNWEDMEAVWNHTLSKLDVPPTDHPILLTEAPLNPKANKEKAAEIFFEQHHVPALFFSVQAVLSLYAAGSLTGAVLDIGDGVTHVCPVYEGFLIPGAVGRTDVAGRDVTRHLQLMLRKEGYNLSSSAEFEICRQIKEQYSYVSLSLAKEEELCHKKRIDVAHCKLPDGNVIPLGVERFRPPEVLFDPRLIDSEEPGLVQLLTSSIRKCDTDIRKELFGKVYLSGGSTLFKGFGERLLQDLPVTKDIKYKVTAPPERKYTTWLGGAILANLTAFRKMLVTREMYQDEGPRVLHKHSFL